MELSIGAIGKVWYIMKLSLNFVPQRYYSFNQTPNVETALILSIEIYANP